MEPRILVLDGNQRASLAAVRSLGTKGLWVAVGESTAESLAGCSRFCRQPITYSDPFRSPRLFFEDILRQIEILGISFLLPITEATTYVLLKYRDELPNHVVLPFPSSGDVEKLANKNALFQTAYEQGIPIPETVFCRNVEEGLSALGNRSNFPLVLKPSKSKVLLEDGIISTKVIVAYTAEEASEAITSNGFFRFPFSIQSFIEGKGQGVFALFDRGQPVCYFAHRRLREKPPAGGVSVLCESSTIDEKLRVYAESLLQAATWHGVAMVEFRVDENGNAYLMEINPRFWGSLQLAIDSGIDFPWLLYLVGTGQPVPRSVWKHRRVRWLLGDLDRLYLVIKAPLAIYPVSKKLKELFYFLKPGLRTRHEVNRWGDMSPFWFELKNYIRGLKK